jgi:hypothetical protein
MLSKEMGKSKRRIIMKKDVFETILVFLLVFGICILIFMLIQLKKEGAKCIQNPSGYFYNNLQASNPDALMDCSCKLTKQDSWVVFGFSNGSLYQKDSSKVTYVPPKLNWTIKE